MSAVYLEDSINIDTICRSDRFEIAYLFNKSNLGAMMGGLHLVALILMG